MGLSDDGGDAGVSDAIYVELDIEGDMATLWECTQTPDLHERWDLRFTEIEYVPREDGEPQRFTYRTGIDGVGVAGTGESTGDREEAGERSSALTFRSADPRAIIREGNGYWRYIPREDGSVRFLTEYNYETRWHRFGTVIDDLFFRPLLGWATAWSFDRLRLWVEEGRMPEDSIQLALVHGVTRFALAFVWVYQGLVPKLLVQHLGELAPIRAAGGLLAANATTVVTVLGVVEVLFGLLLLVAWHTRWLLLLAAMLPAALTAVAALGDPSVLVGPFNPVALTAAMFGLGVAGYLAGETIPTARKCLRERPE